MSQKDDIGIRSWDLGFYTVGGLSCPQYDIASVTL